MNWKQVKAYLKEHPQLIDSSFSMSDSCAQSLLDAVDFPDFETMIVGAKAKSDLTAAQWEPFDRVLEKEALKKRIKFVVMGGTGNRSTIHAKSNS